MAATDLLFQSLAPASRNLLFGAETPAPAPGQTGLAAGIGGVQFGAPGSVASGATVAQAAGFAPIAFGATTVRRTQSAAGASSTQFGSPARSAPQLAAASGFSPTLFGTPTQYSVIHTAVSVGTPEAAPPLAYDDFDSGETWLRTYQTLDGSEPWGSITGTVAGGALNPAAFDIWDDVVRLSLSPDSTFRTAGRFFDLTLVTEARASTAGESLFSVSLRQDASTDDYGVLFEASRASDGTGLVRIEAWDYGPPAGNIYGYLYEVRVGRAPFVPGTRHTYRAVSRPGFYEMFEDGELIASIATDPEKQARPFAAYAMVTTHALAVDSIRLVEYGAVGPGPLVRLGAPTFGQTGVAQGIQATGLSANYHSGGTYHPEGELTTRFGLADVKKIATGFKAAIVPIPSVPLLAAGIASTLHLGVPTYIAHRAVALGPVAKIPQAYRQFDQWGRAVSSAGATGFGNTWSYVRMPKARAGWALGIEPPIFGTPGSAGATSGAADGLTTTTLGQPVARLHLAVASTPAAATFGGPTATVKASASGGRSTSFGHPISGQAVAAQAVYRPTRFGKPKSDILGTCKARGFTTVRLARPGCRTGNFRLATALVAPARFGAASATNTNRALHIAPIVRFGRSLRSRRTTC